MKKNLFLTAFFMLFSTFAIAQTTRLGFDAGGQVRLSFANYTVGNIALSEKYSTNSLPICVNYSILGRHAFKENSRFMIGDYIGFGMGLGRVKYSGNKAKAAIDFVLEFGAVTSYAINDDIDVGLKMIWRGGEEMTDFNAFYGFLQKPVFTPTVRFHKVMAAVSFGKVTVDEPTSLGNFKGIELRYLLSGEIERRNIWYVFGKAEGGKATSTYYGYTGQYNFTQLSLGVGVL